MRKRLIAFGACLLMLLCGCSKAAPEVGVQINGADMDFVPSVFEVSANKDGSYLDGTSASKLPCLLVDSGDEVSLVFKMGRGEEYTVETCEILDADKSLGTPGAKSKYETVDIEEQEDKISFGVDEIGEQQQLVRCKAEKNGKCIYEILFLIESNTDHSDTSSVSAKEKELDPSAPLVTYISTASGDILISCIDKKGQLLLGDIGPVSLYADNLPTNIPDMNLLSEYEASNALGNESDITPPLKLSAIKSNGKWDFFPCDIVYTEYDLNSQPENEEWLAFFKKRLAGEGYDGPVIVTESLSFSTDETSVSIVTASNIVVNNAGDDIDIQSVSEPSNMTPAVYTISVAFVDNQPPTELFSRYTEIPKDRENAARLGTSYYWNTDYPQYTQFISAVQYDKNFLPQIYPIFCDHGGELRIRDFVFAPQYLVCDIDGDSEVEIIQYNQASSSLMCACIVYQMTDNLSTRAALVLN